MKNHIYEINVETKKGKVQLTRWLVVQEAPFPDVEGHGGYLRWRNCEGLKPQYGSSEKPGIGKSYRCNLLRSDLDAGTLGEDCNRTAFAGYEDYYTKAVNPGAITYRGRDLGEMEIKVELRDGLPGGSWFKISVHGYGVASDGEREWIKRAICETLEGYIRHDAESLRRDAFERVRASVAERIAKTRESLAELEVEAKAMIDAAERGGQ